MIMCGACGAWERKGEERKGEERNGESRSDGQAVVVGQSSVHSLEFKLGLIQRNAELTGINSRCQDNLSLT